MKAHAFMPITGKRESLPKNFFSFKSYKPSYNELSLGITDAADNSHELLCTASAADSVTIKSQLQMPAIARAPPIYVVSTTTIAASFNVMHYSSGIKNYSIGVNRYSYIDS